VFVSLEALVNRARSSRPSILRPPNVIGRNTTQNLQSGMVFGYAGMVDTMVRRMRKETGRGRRVIATGGLASLIASETETIERVEPFLTLEGSDSFTSAIGSPNRRNRHERHPSAASISR